MTEALVKLDDVFVIYGRHPSAVPALRGVDLVVNSGETLLITGPSGSGKSTLIKAITGDVEPTAGKLFWCADGLRPSTVVLTQGAGRDLVPALSCLENVCMSIELSGVKRREALLRAAAMLEDCGVSYLSGRKPTDISGGEAQRVAVACALSTSPELVVADEPTAELDRANAELMYSLLSAHVERSGCALVLVSHDPAAETRADKIVTIRRGLVFDCDKRVTNQWFGEIANSQNREAAGRSTDRSLIIHGSNVAKNIGGAAILAPVDLAIERGTLHSIAGPSGTGKTTLLNLIAGFDEPSSGVLVSGAAVPLSTYSAAAGFAEDLDVKTNARLSVEIVGQPASEADRFLELLGVAHLAKRKVCELSGGERQRVALARCLAVEAQLYIVDEPTSHLDERNSALVVSALRALTMRGATVVVASHDASLIAHCDSHTLLG